MLIDDGSQGKEAFFFFLSFFSFSPSGLLHDEGGNTGTDNIYISFSLSKEGKACCTDVDFGAVLASLRRDL